MSLPNQTFVKLGQIAMMSPTQLGAYCDYTTVNVLGIQVDIGAVIVPINYGDDTVTITAKIEVYMLLETGELDLNVTVLL